MRIGIDIDGVLTNLEQFLLDYGTKFNYENNIENKVNVSAYDEYQAFGWTKEQGDKFWNTYLKYYVLNSKPRKFAKEVIDKLKENNEIYIVTARNEYGLLPEDIGKMQEFTKRWLNNNEIYYNKLVFSGEDKLQYCKNNNIDILIDDSDKNIKEVSSYIKVFCMDAPYNKSCEGKNIVRVHSWYDILEKIETIENKSY